MHPLRCSAGSSRASLQGAAGRSIARAARRPRSAPRWESARDSFKRSRRRPGTPHGQRGRPPYRRGLADLGNTRPRLPRAHRRARAADPGVGGARSRGRPRARPRGRRDGAHRAAARRAVRREGHLRHGGAADRVRLPALRGPPAGQRQRRRRRAARGRRARPRQDGDDRVRLPHARRNAEPAPPGSHARRLVERLRRRRRRWHGPVRPRNPDRRIDDPAGRVLRRLRLQADLRLRQQRRRAPAGHGARHRRLVRPQHRGPRPRRGGPQHHAVGGAGRALAAAAHRRRPHG